MSNHSIRAVTAFLTSDDKIHRSEELAAAHQAKLDLEALVEQYSYRDIDAQGIAAMLCDHAESFSVTLAKLAKP